MNRAIKFRGQTRRTGEHIINMAGDKCKANWVYGGIFPQNNDGDFAIIYQQPECEKRVVYADTVGQYIGISDKKSKEIYEGDIVKIDGQQELFTVVWVCDTARFGLQSKTQLLYFEFGLGSKIEVIGNIYENADLLKE